MNRVNAIIKNERYLMCLRRNEAAEADRRFCHHDMTHFLNVARIGQILNLQEQAGIPKEMIYAAALVHDIGRFRQYEDAIPHEAASAQLAPEILQECGFDDKETGVIIDAVSNHRNADISAESSLRGILYRADKLSRECFYCPAEPDCNWKNKKKNKKLLL